MSGAGNPLQRGGLIMDAGSTLQSASAGEGTEVGVFSEAVEVVCSPGGQPLRLFWKGHTYKVAADPVRWYERRNWWDEEPRAERGHGAGLVDSEIWRIQARLNPRSPLRTLDISNNQLTDITMLSNLSKLAEFDFSYNQCTALPTLASLVTINGSNNALTSLEPLDKISTLNYVYMDYNPEVSQIAFLANNPNMVQINVFGTKVTQAQANKCLDQSIIVNYDPT